MIRRVVSILALAILAVCLSAALSAEDAAPTVSAPSKTTTPPPGGPPTGPAPTLSGRVPPPGPSPCVVNALRLLSPLRVQMLGEQLKLSDDQKAKVADILNKLEEAQKPLIKTQRLAAEEFVVSLTKPGLQAVELQAGAEAAMKAEAAILTERIKTLVGLRAALAPDQLTELNKMIDQTTIPWRPGASSPAIERFQLPPGNTPAAPGATEAKPK